jgi:uncharacterized surface protein with fasciclin (FAS1) repeats
MLRKKSIISMMAALFLTAGFMTGCGNDNDDNGNITGGNNGKTVMQAIQDDADLSIFAEAVERAGLTDMLNNKDQSWTVFAPTNDAFHAKYPTEEALEAFLNDSAEAVVRYHIVPYRTILAKDLAAASPMNTFLNGTEIRAANKTNGSTPEVGEEGEEDEEGEEVAPVVELNYGQATIIEPDMLAQNGVIHEIDHVLNIRTVQQ